jgi:hypothetical protein
MNELSELLSNATRAVEMSYFALPIAGGLPAHRERVYCYELYHQLRSIWPGGRYSLNGEVDKRGHPHLRARAGLRSAIPDFLVHVPGEMGGNYAIIEVKPFSAAPAGIKKDLRTLTTFVDHWGYRKAILLIYGGDAGECFARIQRIADDLDDIVPVELWHHAYPGIGAAQFGMIGERRAAA